VIEKIFYDHFSRKKTQYKHPDNNIFVLKKLQQNNFLCNELIKIFSCRINCTIQKGWI